jgi:RNA polymerase sigma factor (sigma-70 family)
LYEAHAPEIERYLRRLSLDDSRCEDWTQETFTKAWQAWGRFTSENARAWLYQIARRVLIDAKRRDKQRVLEPLDAIEDWCGANGVPLPAELVVDGPELDGERHEMQRAVRQTLRSLSPRLRLLLWQANGHRVPHAEIAAQRQNKPGTVKGGVHLARQRFAALYDGPR